MAEIRNYYQISIFPSSLIESQVLAARVKTSMKDDLSQLPCSSGVTMAMFWLTQVLCGTSGKSP